jgi:hypothetical protein
VRIILCELKKIWNPKTVAVAVLLSGMFYVMFLSFYIGNYPNGHPHAEDVALCTALTLKYGPTLEPGELEEFIDQTRPGLIEEAEGYIASNPLFAEYGIYGYSGVQSAASASAQTLSEEEEARLFAILDEWYRSETGSDFAYKIDALDSLAERYKNVLDPSALINSGVVEGLPGTEAARARSIEMAGSEEYRGIIPAHAVQNTVDYARNLSILLVFVTLILAAPLLAFDRMGKVHLLQYTAKEGRGIVAKQLIATLISSALATTALLLVFGAVYAPLGTQVFWGNDVSSFNGFYYTPIRLAFGQLIIIRAGMLYLIGAAVSMLAFILSRFCGNFVALAAGLIPEAVAGTLLCNFIVFERPLNAFMAESGIALFEPLVCAVLLALSATAAFCVVKRERGVDVA